MSQLAEHRPVLLQEAVAALCVRPAGTYVDGTLGRAGHTRAILERLGPAGRLLALDCDREAVAHAGEIEDPRLIVRHGRFGNLIEILQQSGFAIDQAVDGVLLDVGVSSPQLDQGRRGFSFRHDAPLDMRMDDTHGESAAEWLQRASAREIAEVIRNYGEERFAFQIAEKIVATRRERPLATTSQLAALVRESVRTREPGQDAATRTFQAIRIHINQELDQLALVLPQAVRVLRAGGRLVVICFHSLEDRIVKRFLRREANPDEASRKLPLVAADLPAPRMRVLGQPIGAGATEIAANPRARSARMRVAEKLAPGSA